MNVILFGAPGSGKGTQAQLISKKYNLLKFSPGESLRMIVSRSVILDNVSDDEISIIKDTIDKGLFLDKKILNKVVEQFINKDGFNGVIFDGYPRDISQYNDFLNFNKKGVDFCFYLKVSLEDIINRIQSRRICSICSTSLSKDETKCPACGSEKFTVRDDDKDTDIVKSRFTRFQENTMKIYDHFLEDFSSKCHEIDGTLTIDEIFKTIINIIEKNAVL